MNKFRNILNFKRLSEWVSSFFYQHQKIDYQEEIEQKEDKLYAVLDIETTGGGNNDIAITEIAIYIFDGKEIIDQFITLVNPKRKIQDYVVKLTGITQKMVKKAPKFEEIAKRIVQMTEGCLIVAHNAQGDYQTIRTEFARLGFDYQRDTICTVELSKELIPESPSHGLDNICKYLGIPLMHRHRAHGDALATVELLKYLLVKDKEQQIIKSFINTQKPKLSLKFLKILDNLPTKIGVYYIYDNDKNLIYLRRSENIYKSLSNHFSSKENINNELQNEVFSVEHTLTGTELIANIKEFVELKLLEPRLNNIKFLEELKYGLFVSYDENSYANLHYSEIDLPTEGVMQFRNIIEVKGFILKLIKEFNLNPDRTNLDKEDIPEELLSNLKIEKISAKNYNQKVEKALKKYSFSTGKYAIVDKGRKKNEKSVILIEDGFVKGYAYVDFHHKMNLQMLRKIIEKVPETRFMMYIFQRHFSKRHKKMSVINL